MKPQILLAILGCIGLFILARCDTAGPGDDTISPDPDDDTTHTLTPASEALLTTNRLTMRLDSSGAISSLSWADLKTFKIFDAGLWLAGSQEGEVRALVREFTRSNYIARAGNQPLGVFTLTPDSLEEGRITNWPTEYDASVDENGQPLLWGDAMLWSAFLPEHQPNICCFHPETLIETPLTGIHFTQAVYGYKEPALQDVVFVRYELMNDTGGNLTDLYVGFFADVDLENRTCFSAGANATGFDPARALSYTYPREATGDAVLPCPIGVLGLTFLESPVATVPPHTVTSHTILYKNVGPGSESGYAFSEATLRNPQDVLYRLQGLSSQGEPMIDPTTGLTTPYAFTGDPVAETGWLDVPTDVRSLTTAGPFSLAEGQKQTLTVAIVAAQGNVLSEALAQLHQKVDLLQSQPETW